MKDMTSEDMCEMVKRLRQLTGEGLIDCKKALVAHNWDSEKAIEHLHYQGQLVVRSNRILPCGCSY